MPEYLPITPPSWATDTNYPAGANPWSGGPTKIAPSAGAIAGGLVPNVQVPAQHLNYQLGAIGDAMRSMARVQAHAALRTWSRATLGAALSTPQVLVPVLPINTHDANGDRQRAITAIGSVSGSGYWVAVSPDGANFETPRLVRSGGSLPNVNNASRGAPGEFFYADLTLAGIRYSVDHGATESSKSWGSNPKAGVHYAPGSPTPYIVLDDHGGTSAAASIAALATTTQLPGVTALITTSHPVMFADDGGLNVVCICQSSASAVAQVFASHDGGATWGSVTTLVGTTGDLTYSKYWNQFIFWDEGNGRIYTSSTGSAWNTVGTTATTANGLVISAGKCLAAVGPALVKTWSNPLSGSNVQKGIAYSLDLGVSWNTFAFSEIVPSGSFGLAPSIIQVLSSGGRVHCLTQNAVYSSGYLSAPSVEF